MEEGETSSKPQRDPEADKLEGEDPQLRLSLALFIRTMVHGCLHRGIMKYNKRRPGDGH